MRFLTGAKETGVTPRISDSVRDAHGCGLEYITSSQHDPLSLSLCLYCACVCLNDDLRPVAPPTSVGQQQQPIYLLSIIIVYTGEKMCVKAAAVPPCVGWFKMRKRPPYSYRLSTAAYNPPGVVDVCVCALFPLR